MNQTDSKKYVLGMPDILYKYRVITDSSIPILENQELYFASPLKFNDPFDSCVPLTLANLEEIVLKTIEQDDTFSSQSLKDSLHQGNKTVWDECRRNIEVLNQKDHQNRRDKEFGICSFTEHYNNLLMWSHYTASHRGFCIGLDIKSIVDRVYPQIRLNGGNLDVIWCFRVMYNEIYPLLKYHKIDRDSDTRSTEERVLEAFQPLLNKSIEWSYEKEWRLVSYDANNFTIPFLPEDLKVIYLGCAISECNRERIERLVKQKYQTTEIYQAKMASGTWGLGFELV